MAWHLNLHMQFKLLNSLADTVWVPLALPISYQIRSNGKIETSNFNNGTNKLTNIGN